MGAYQYMTTDNGPGFLAPGTGTVTLRTNNGGGQDDHLTIYLQQVNRDAMVNMTIFQSLDVDDPTPASSTEVQSRYFIANTADRVPIVPVFHYGVNSNGGDIQYPAGPSVTYEATWDTGQTSTPDIAFAPTAKALHGHTILGVPIPKMATGKHTFTVTAKLPSGKTYTTPSMEVLVYAQTIYVTYGAFDPKNPQDDLPKFVPGADVNGNNVDLLNGPQTMQLNILVGRGSSGTFDVHLRNVTHYPGIAMNYPVGAASPDPNPDIDFGSGDIDLLAVPIPKGGTPKVVKLPLEIHDYAGTATIEVTMPYRKTTFTAKRRIPLDDDGNSLPDAGWRAGTSSTLIITKALTRDEDLDTTPSASGAPPEGILGDGLTAFEEYRGFVIAGTYQRLDPAQKDLFFVADADVLVMPVSALSILATLPQSFHFVDMNEAQMTSSSDPAQDKIRPVINPNRAGIIGASEQRAVRLRSRLDAPIFHEDSNGQDYPGQFVALGYTWRDGEDVAIIHELSSIGVSSPNGTQVVELYPAGFNNFAIHYGANNAPDSLADPYGAPVVYCANELTDVHCVVNDTARHVLRRPVQEPQLYAVAAGDDYYTKFGWGTCPLFLSGSAVLMTPAQFQQTHTVVAGHEVGHALHLTHQNSDCSDIMFTLVIPAVPGTNQGPIRHPITDVLPLPTNYGPNAVQGMRLHEKF